MQEGLGEICFLIIKAVRQLGEPVERYQRCIGSKQRPMKFMLLLMVGI